MFWLYIAFTPRAWSTYTRDLINSVFLLLCLFCDGVGTSTQSSFDDNECPKNLGTGQGLLIETILGL